MIGCPCGGFTVKAQERCGRLVLKYQRCGACNRCGRWVLEEARNTVASGEDARRRFREMQSGASYE